MIKLKGYTQLIQCVNRLYYHYVCAQYHQKTSLTMLLYLFEYQSLESICSGKSLQMYQNVSILTIDIQTDTVTFMVKYVF